MNGTFKSVEVARLAGVPYRTLDHWDRVGFITPSEAKARGTGTERLYTFNDLVLVRLAGFLRGKGVALKALVPVFEFLKRQGNLDGGFLVWRGKEARLLRDPEAFERLCSAEGFGVGMLLNLPQLIQELVQALAGEAKKAGRG